MLTKAFAAFNTAVTIKNRRIIRLDVCKMDISMFDWWNNAKMCWCLAWFVIGLRSTVLEYFRRWVEGGGFQSDFSGASLLFLNGTEIYWFDARTRQSNWKCVADKAYVCGFSLNNPQKHRRCSLSAHNQQRNPPESMTMFMEEFVEFRFAQLRKKN